MHRLNEIKKLLSKDQLILFVGSGVSATLKLPDWRQLARRIAVELNYSPEVFDILTNSSPLIMAEFYKISKGSIGPLRSQLDVEWHKNCEEKIKKSKIHKAITEIGFPIVYTTNYDRYLEHSFNIFKGKDSFTKIIGPENLSSIKSDRTQIIKFHGDFDDDQSIVLSESDYFRRLSFEDPLDIKFRSDTLSKSLLFVGYSLSDLNIRYILYKLSQIWKGSKNPPKSYLFSSSTNEIQEKVLAAWNVEIISSKLPDKSKALQKFLEDLKNT